LADRNDVVHGQGGFGQRLLAVVAARAAA